MTEQAELDQLADAEYQRLKKQVRQIHGELEVLSEEKTIYQKKHKQLVSALQKEYNQLKSEIILLREGTHAKREIESEMKFEDIMKKFTIMQRALEDEKINLSELEGHIRKIEKEINALRKGEITDSSYKIIIEKNEKEIVKLENRLDVVNKKCSDILTENTKLRDCIDHMLQDRTHFNNVWQSLVAQFNEGKKFIIDLIDQSTLAYDQREELCNKLQALKERNETEKLLHLQEMRELQRILEHDEKLQHFYDVKGQRRVNTELDAREANKKIQLKETLEKQLLEYKNIISRVKEICDETDIDKLVSQFTTQEEENFALFNYVNELSHEVEVLNDVVQKINDEIGKQKVDQAANEQKRQEENKANLEKELSLKELKMKQACSEKEKFNEKLQSLLQGIEKLFRLVHWDDVPILNVLGSKSFLTVFNVNLFLGIIAKRINIICYNLTKEESTSRILGKRDRIPKFNVKEQPKDEC